MSQELREDTELSHYRIVSKIGAGGMGEVYLIEWFDLSRDGKPTLFSRGATTKDVVLISRFRH